MTSTWWLMAAQTVVFLAVTGFAWWAARLLVQAADTSTRAAEDAVRAAAEIRQVRELLQSLLDERAADAGAPDGSPGTGATARPGRHARRPDTSSAAATGAASPDGRDA